MKDEEVKKETVENTESVKDENAETLNEKTKSDKKEKKTKKDSKEVEIEQLKAEVAKLNDKIKTDSEAYLAARADLENIRKRLIEQSALDRKYASQNLVGDLIQPIDMLLKIVDYKSDNPEVNNYVYGFKMLTDQLQQILEKDGLKQIKALGEKFDPNFMQAMSTEKKEDIESGIVIEVLQNGYIYKDRLLKPAMVKVSE